MRFLDAAAVAALGPVAAVGAIREALRAGLDPALDPPRSAVGLSHGQFLLMPSETASAAGVKVVSVNPGHEPRIQGLYLLFDRATLAPSAVLDGGALTTLRTPAVSVAVVLDDLPDRPVRVAVAGTGPQALAHVSTLAAHRELADVTHLVRAGRPGAVLGTPAADDAVRRADVVVCATSARTPLFDPALVADHAVVIAVGSHEPDARELDAALLARSTVVVEDVAAALREAGDVVLAVASDHLVPTDLVAMADVVTGRAPVAPDRPLVFKSVGMSWEDLVLAEAVVARVSAQ